ncbi:alpha/beta hydrolase family protein [Methylobacterium variabile]|uniref:alpha/beta hydrolase family protein n=1 Tax=Methylobacterium variabile TaxID=298794 RepID=UPI000A41433D|nr:acetylhydrolase [Methylobacterium variabile]
MSDQHAVHGTAAKSGLHQSRRYTRRRFGQGIIVAGIAASPLRAIASQNASEAIDVLDLDWVDTLRDRRVPSRLYWPAGAARQRTVPLIVFSHGLGGSRTGYSYLGRHWSAHGYASLHVQHAGSDSSIWFGNPITLLDRVDEAVKEQEAVARARDLRFALDRLTDERTSPFAHRIDRQRIVAAGHSFGANTTLLVAGAKVVREGKPVTYRDERFRAGLVISAPPFFGETDLRSVLASIDIPTLHVTALRDTIHVPGRFTSPVADRLAVFNAIRSGRKMLAVFEGGSHSIFTDRALSGGPTLNRHVKMATAALSLAFLDLAFRLQTASLAEWDSRWSPIMAVRPVPFPIEGINHVRHTASDAASAP